MKQIITFVCCWLFSSKLSFFAVFMGISSEYIILDHFSTSGPVLPLALV